MDRMSPTSSDRRTERNDVHACIRTSERILLAFTVFLGALLPAGADSHRASLAKIDFVRDIQPILAAKCVRCHGPQTSEAGLRLDNRKTAIGLLESGTRAIVPGKPNASELIHRISADPSERMPPEGDPL